MMLRYLISRVYVNGYSGRRRLSGFVIRWNNLAWLKGRILSGRASRWVVPRGFSTERESKRERVGMEEEKLSIKQYHEITDEYLEELVDRLERLQENRKDIDVEYSSGVLTVDIVDVGTYVINKQPPSRQLWLSSPISGPRRFDWVNLSRQDYSWISKRDSVYLNEILSREIGVKMS